MNNQVFTCFVLLLLSTINIVTPSTTVAGDEYDETYDNVFPMAIDSIENQEMLIPPFSNEPILRTIRNQRNIQPESIENEIENELRIAIQLKENIMTVLQYMFLNLNLNQTNFYEIRSLEQIVQGFENREIFLAELLPLINTIKYSKLQPLMQVLQYMVEIFPKNYETSFTILKLYLLDNAIDLPNYEVVLNNIPPTYRPIKKDYNVQNYFKPLMFSLTKDLLQWKQINSHLIWNVFASLPFKMNTPQFKQQMRNIYLTLKNKKQVSVYIIHKEDDIAKILLKVLEGNSETHIVQKRLKDLKSINNLRKTEPELSDYERENTNESTESPDEAWLTYVSKYDFPNDVLKGFEELLEDKTVLKRIFANISNYMPTYVNANDVIVAVLDTISSKGPGVPQTPKYIIDIARSLYLHTKHMFLYNDVNFQQILQYCMEELFDFYAHIQDPAFIEKVAALKAEIEKFESQSFSVKFHESPRKVLLRNLKRLEKEGTVQLKKLIDNFVKYLDHNGDMVMNSPVTDKLEEDMNQYNPYQNIPVQYEFVDEDENNVTPRISARNIRSTFSTTTEKVIENITDDASITTQNATSEDTPRTIKTNSRVSFIDPVSKIITVFNNKSAVNYSYANPENLPKEIGQIFGDIINNITKLPPKNNSEASNEKPTTLIEALQKYSKPVEPRTVIHTKPTTEKPSTKSIASPFIKKLVVKPQNTEASHSEITTETEEVDRTTVKATEEINIHEINHINPLSTTEQNDNLSTENFDVRVRPDLQKYYYLIENEHNKREVYNHYVVKKADPIYDEDFKPELPFPTNFFVSAHDGNQEPFQPDDENFRVSVDIGDDYKNFDSEPVEKIELHNNTNPEESNKLRKREVSENYDWYFEEKPAKHQIFARKRDPDFQETSRLAALNARFGAFRGPEVIPFVHQRGKRSAVTVPDHIWRRFEKEKV